MASRDPSPVLPDLSDAKFALLKPFLDWLRRRMGLIESELGAALDQQTGCVFTFSHPAFSVAGAATRRLWTGWATTTWAAGDAWKPRYVIPDNGALVSLSAHHGAHTPDPEGTFIIYTVWRSTDGGATFLATALTITMGPGPQFAHVAIPVAVNRGDMIGVEAIATAAATGTDRLNVTLVYKRAA